MWHTQKPSANCQTYQQCSIRTHVPLACGNGWIPKSTLDPGGSLNLFWLP
uniref:Uncharacterized protein n=1 Tax=Anguilla anguilla TaxID=7936 RepID=A0A0E9PUB3_ANGAN